jgi:hypothetical protein
LVEVGVVVVLIFVALWGERVSPIEGGELTKRVVEGCGD